MASKTIEAKLIISGEDRASTEIAKVVKAFKEAEKAAGFSDKVERLGKAYTDVERQMKAAGAVMSARGPLEATVKNLAAVERETARLAKEYDVARKAVTDFAAAQKIAKTADGVQQQAALSAEVKRLGTAYRTAEKDVKQLTAAFSAQTSTLRAAEGAASKLGVDLSSLERHQTTLARQTDLATRALRAQIAAEEAGARATEARNARSARRREALGTIAAGAGVLAAHEGKKIGLEAINSAAAFDIAVRKQKVYTDISESDQAALLKQATKIGQETQFSNLDVVHAQTAAMQGLPAGFAPKLKAEVAQGIIDNVRNFSTLMDTDLKEGAETIRSYLQATGKNISTKELALQEANKATNQLVKMAKLGGMNGEDVSQYVKFAAAPGTAAGVSTESLMSLGALARRGGLRGDEAGVFIRSVASHLVSPTNKGMAALNAVGLNFSDYVTKPQALSTGSLEGAFRLKMGKEFTPEIRRRLDAINADKDLIADQGRYTTAVVQATGGILGKDKKGKVRASDARTAAKTIGEFYKVSQGDVDVERLLDDAMSRKMTLAQLNALLTDKHGGKGAITQRQWDEFKIAREEIKKSGDDPDFAKKKADYVFAGVGGSVENLKGSFENLVLQIGNANKGLIKWSADLAGNALDMFSGLTQGQQQALSLGGGAAALGTGAVATYTLTKNLLGFGGGAIALNGSAAALTKSAALLDAAAVRLAGGGLDLPENPGGNPSKKGSKLGRFVKGAAGMVGVGVLADLAQDYGVLQMPDLGKDGLGRSALNFLDPNLGNAVLGDRAKAMPSMTLAPGAMPLTIQGTGIGGFGLSGPVNPEAAGKEAGEKVGTGVADGIKAKAGEVVEQGRSLLQKLNEQFREGIFVPINFVPGGGMGGGSGIQTASFGGGGGLGGLIQRASLGGGGIGAGGGGGVFRRGGGGGTRTYEAPTGPYLGTGSTAGSLTRLSEEAARAAGIDPRYLHGIRAGESGHRDNYDVKSDRVEDSYGPFQMNRRGGLGQIFEKETGLSVKDPRTIADQARWVARHIAKKLRANPNYNPGTEWFGYKGRREADPKWGNSGYRPNAAAGLEPKLIRGLDGKEGLDLGNGTMKMPDGSIRSITRSGLEIPEAPAGGLGAGTGGRADMRAAADRMHAAAERFENASFYGQIEVTGLRRSGIRATSLKVRGRGGMTADLGISEPGAKEDLSDWI